MSQGSMQIEKKDGLEECEVIEFTMKANNGLADSPAGTTTGGFPICENIDNKHLIHIVYCRSWQFIAI